MNIAGPFIRRPVMTTLVMSGVLVAGLVGYRLLPISDLPVVDFPTIQVRASLPGASPQTMAAAVATPLEKQFSTIPGIDSMTSVSGLGTTAITLQFVLERDIDAAALDVQAALSQAARSLPTELLPPSFQKVNPADTPIMFVALTSPTLPLPELNEYGETLIAQRISMVPGVAAVQVYGSQKFAVRIQLDPRALASRGLGIDEVAAAVRAGNVTAPAGVLWGPHRAWTIEADGQLRDAAGFARLPVAYRNGAPVRLADLGRVLDSVQNDKAAAWYIDQRTVNLAILRQPGSNAVAVADGVRAALAELSGRIPASVQLRVMIDRSQPIRASVHDVQLTLLIALALVVLVIFIFLKKLSATLIPSLALPLSTIGTFACMYLLGYSLDNLSLMALTLAVGFVVDDAIVVLENIVRHVELGKGRLQAALDGAGEVGFTIVSMTLSLAAVFLPLLFMGGVVGRLFQEFGVVIMVAVLVSGVVSLTLTPMLAGRFLREAPGGPGAGDRPQAGGALVPGAWAALLGALDRAWAGLAAAYARSLAGVVARPGWTLAFSLLVLAGTAALYRAVPKGFIPNEDYSFLQGITEGAQGASFEEMAKHQAAAAAILRADPSVEAFISGVGGGGPNAIGNQGRFFIRLKPRRDRPGGLDADAVVAGLRPKLAAVPGLRVYLQNPPPIRLGGMLTKSQYQLTLLGSDLEQLWDSAAALEARLRELPGLVDVTSDMLLANPQLDVRIDRDRAASLGVSVAAIEDALYSAYGGRQVSTIYTETNQHWVILELLPERQREPDDLAELWVRAAGGGLVPLASVARVERGVGPVTINHYGQLPAVTLSFNLAPGAAIGDAVSAARRLAEELLPAGVTTTFVGAAQAFETSFAGLGWLLLAAVLVIYLVLGVLYESFIHPLTILSGLPFAGFGALATLLVFGAELNVYSFVGLIMLIGIVKKNAIMMIDFALDAQRQEGLAPAAAILQACAIRFRPIMMTTVTTLAATMPIAIGLGVTGVAARQSLGLAVVGGLLFSQAVTLYVTPVLYLQFERLRGARSGTDAAHRPA